MKPQVLSVLLLGAIPAAAAAPALDRQFEQTVRPFVTKYCIGCHSGKSPAAQFDLKSYTTMDTVTRDYPRWALVLERLTAKEMPPKPMPPPPDGLPPAGDRLDSGGARGRDRAKTRAIRAWCWRAA